MNFVRFNNLLLPIRNVLLFFFLLGFCAICLDDLSTQNFCANFDYVFLQDFKSSVKINFILREFISFHVFRLFIFFFPLLGLKKKQCNCLCLMNTQYFETPSLKIAIQIGIL